MTLFILLLAFVLWSESFLPREVLSRRYIGFSLREDRPKQWVLILLLRVSLWTLLALCVLLRSPFNLSFLGVVVSTAGHAVAWSALNTNPWCGTEVKIHKGQTCCARGIYARVRHPLYLGRLIYWLGWPVIWGAWPALFVWPVLVYLMIARLNDEEDMLLGRGRNETYEAYQREVPWRLLPGVY